MSKTDKPLKGHKADYRGAKPEQVARAVLKYRPAKDGVASLSRSKQASSPRPARQP